MYTEDALRRYLTEAVFPQLAGPPYGEIEAFRFSSRRPVYLYHDRASHARVVGKVFSNGNGALDKAWERAEKEYENLKLVRESLHLNNGQNRVVAPLGKSRELSALLVTSYSPGDTLDKYIAAAIHERRRGELFDKLGALARFLVSLHDSSPGGSAVSISLPRRYLDRVLRRLGKGLLDRRAADSIRDEAAGWWERKSMVAEGEVIVHGDATPTNFLFPDDRVVGIDFEKMKRADRCWDLGFIAAELKHHFMWRAGQGGNAEPFIGHFLWQYAASRAQQGTFETTTRRLPLYMALGLLRIARNDWLSKGYRLELVQEARQCLRFKP